MTKLRTGLSLLVAAYRHSPGTSPSATRGRAGGRTPRAQRRPRNRAPALLLALIVASAAVPVSRAMDGPTVFINEIHYDNTGTDAGEFIEIAGPAGTNLSGYALVLYNGANGLVYDTDALTGTIPDQQNGFGTLSFAYPVNGIQNGSPDGLALVQSGTVIQFLSYEGVFGAVDGPAAGMTSVDIGELEDGANPLGTSLQLQGAGSTYGDFVWTAPSAHTSGQVNTGQSFMGGAGMPFLSIENVSVIEGNAGTTTASFVVAISTTAHTGISFDIATADGGPPDGATVADGDYLSRTASVTIPPGEAMYVFDIEVVGDTNVEQDERFFARVSSVTGAMVTDGEGEGEIVDDDVAPPAPSDVVISQVYGGGGNAGATLKQDFVELFNRGTSTVSLAGWSVQYVSAAGSGTWAVTPLAGTIAPGGYYLVRQAQGAGGTLDVPAPDAIGTIPMSATAGKVALQMTTTAIAGNCPLAATADLVGYGVTASCFEGLGSAPATTNSTAAFRKRGGCFDSDDNRIDFTTANPAPRNSAEPARSCVPVAAAIHDIQGNGGASPLAGQDVITSGIVTARKSNGFFLQTPDASVDADPATSEGLFVFTSSAPAVAVGDEVSVRGTAGEFFNLTQVEASLPGDLTVSGSGAVLPGPVAVTPALLDPAGPPDQLERFEGMRLAAASLVSVAPTNEFGEIATVLPGVARPMREPGISILAPVPPDPTTGVADCCIPRFDENGERLWLDTDGLGAPPLVVTSWVTLGAVTGPLDFSFGAYKLLPEAPPIASPNIAGSGVPDPDADELTVAGFNIENFAGSAVQLAKAAQAIRLLMRSPDIIGHIEILNLATLEALADRVNADTMAAGGADPGYQARLIPAPQGGTQNVGFLVKTSRVQIDGVTQERAGDTFVNPNTGVSELLHDRPPLVLRATFDPAGPDPRAVIVVVNHLRSFIDVELVGGEGVRVRAKRKAQAESVAGLLQELQTLNAGVPVIAVGDFNAFEFNDGYTDPIATLRGAPTPDDQIVEEASPDLVDPDFVNLTDGLPVHERYSFIFAGTPQALDHVLVNTAAGALVTRYAVTRANADFPNQFAADSAQLERSSDHDMPVAYFRFPDVTAPVLSAVPDDLSVTATGPDGAVVSYALPSAQDHRDGVVAVVCTPPPGATFAIGTTTVTCEAEDASGNVASATFEVTVVDPQTAGQMVGAGRVDVGARRVVFAFHAAERRGASQASLVALVTDARRTSLLLSLETASVFFTNDPAFDPWPVPGVDTVVFSGRALWNGRPGYTYEARAADQGRTGHHDTFALTVRDAAGAVVFSAGGTLDAGNNQTLRP